jgi:flagellum-specific ATP synthase
MAQREIALAIGEPPVTKGYPPSVFARLPQLVERAGNGKEGGGSITAFYTVLVEGDDQQDPVGDSARAILDGHIVLSRELANHGHFPAIDLLNSSSRLLVDIVPSDERELVLKAIAALSAVAKSRDLIDVGAYRSGTNPELDAALRILPELNRLLCQGMQEVHARKDGMALLKDIVSSGGRR